MIPTESTKGVIVIVLPFLSQSIHESLLQSQLVGLQSKSSGVYLSYPNRSSADDLQHRKRDKTLDVSSGMKNKISMECVRNAEGKGSTSQDTVILVESWSRAADCSKGKSTGKGDIVCYNCGMNGHRRAEFSMEGKGGSNGATGMMIKDLVRQVHRLAEMQQWSRPLNPEQSLFICEKIQPITLKNTCDRTM